MNIISPQCIHFSLFPFFSRWSLSTYVPYTKNVELIRIQIIEFKSEMITEQDHLVFPLSYSVDSTLRTNLMFNRSPMKNVACD